MEIGFGLSIPNWFILISTVFVLLYLYMDKKFRYWEKQGIESQTKYEFFKGIIENFKMPLHECIVETYKRHGRVFGTCMPSQDLWISDPRLLKYILVKDFPIFRNRMNIEFGDPTVDKMLSLLVDEDWKRIRNIMSPTFTSSRMRKMAYLVKECAEFLGKRFEGEAEKGEEFNCKELFSEFAIDVTACTAFATKLNAQEKQNSEFVNNARMAFDRDVPKLTFLVFILAPKLLRYLKLEFIPKKITNYFRNVVLKILEERKEKKNRGNDFLQLMMDAQEGVLENTAEDLKEVSNEINDYQTQLKQKTMSLDEIVGQCFLFFIAGHSATTATLSFLCYQMALNPECQEKLLKEIDETWEKHGDISFDTVSKMPYLDAILNETVRIQNPGVMLSRIASEDYDLADTGITIKKGTTVIIPTQGMHNDPEFFPEPEKFKPERFLPENRDSIQPYTFLPFGEGPRHCIGMRFIIMVMKLCIVHALRNVKLTATEETKKPLKYYYGQGLQLKELILKTEKR